MGFSSPLWKASSSPLFIKSSACKEMFSKTIAIFFSFSPLFLFLFSLEVHFPSCHCTFQCCCRHTAWDWVKMPRPSHQQHPSPSSHSWNWESEGQMQEGGDPCYGHYYRSLWRSFNPEPLIKTDFMLHVKTEHILHCLHGQYQNYSCLCAAGLCCTEPLILEMKLQGFNHLSESPPDCWRYF